MKDGHCPKCGSTAVYRRADLGKGSHGNAIQASTTPFPRFLWVDVYVCVNCGYAETYVAEGEQLSYIADHWLPVAARPAAAPAHGTESGTEQATRRLPATPDL